MILNVVSDNYLIILCVVLIITIVYSWIKRKQSNYIIENSEKFALLMDLNSDTKFHSDIVENHKVLYTCNTKYKYDRLDLQEYSIEYMIEKIQYFENVIDKLTYNKEAYYDYLSDYSEIVDMRTEYATNSKMNLIKYQNLEKKILKKKLLETPITDSNLFIKAKYTTPKGRRIYTKWVSFNYREVKEIYDDAVEVIKYKNSREQKIKYERNRLSSSLRFDVFKRDGYRCQICGLTQKEGAKLHVDHIIPVSKMGKTEMNNLQTLCARCNLGKKRQRILI